MKLIESSVTLLKQENGLDGLNKHIEKCGRTCYKSEKNIKDGSAEKFVNAMIKSHHGAMLEHGTVYLKVPCDAKRDYKIDGYSIYSADHVIPRIGNQYSLNPYSKSVLYQDSYYITTNYRVLVENGWLEDLQYMCEPTEHHEKRYTLRFVCDRGITHELVRHRKFSFGQESTRYCNYGNKNELTFICPSWIDYNEIINMINVIKESSKEVQKVFYEAMFTDTYEDNSEYSIASANEKRCELILVYDMISAEKNYMYLVNHGYKPQQARAVLPTMIKSEICMTGFASDWRFFFDLRLFGKTGEPHPDMLRVADLAKLEFQHISNLAKKEFEKENEWEYIMSYPSKFNEKEKDGE